jgi:hypothetical protein
MQKKEKKECSKKQRDRKWDSQKEESIEMEKNTNNS